jgi:hypothetical protein
MLRLVLLAVCSTTNLDPKPDTEPKTQLQKLATGCSLIKRGFQQLLPEKNLKDLNSISNRKANKQQDTTN